MNTFKKWLLQNSYNFKIVNLVNGNIAYIIDLTYEGLYPSKQVIASHTIIRTKAKKLKLKYENAGYYNGALITCNN